MLKQLKNDEEFIEVIKKLELLKLNIGFWVCKKLLTKSLGFTCQGAFGLLPPTINDINLSTSMLLIPHRLNIY